MERIACVADQVDNDLLEQNRIGDHLGQVGRTVDPKVHAQALDVPPQQSDAGLDDHGQAARLELRLSAGQKLADALDDASGMAGLLAHALQGLDQLRVGPWLTRQRIEHPGVVAGDHRQRLVQLVRQRGSNLPQHRQPRVVRHGLHLPALALFHLLALGDVEDGRHPADLLPLGIHQRRLEDHHIHDPPIPVLPAGFVAHARRLASHVAQVAGHALADLVGQPVRHGRQEADQLLRLVAHHVGHCLVHVHEPAVQIAGADAHGQRILHRCAPCRLGAPRLLGARDAAHLPAQHRARGEQQQHEAPHEGHRQRAPPGGNLVTGTELQPGLRQTGAHRYPIPRLLRAAHARHGRGKHAAQVIQSPTAHREAETAKAHRG